MLRPCCVLKADVYGFGSLMRNGKDAPVRKALEEAVTRWAPAGAIAATWAGDAALIRHLDRQLGRTVRALVEKPGVARAEDFTEVAFEGEAAPGTVITGTIARHDGRRAQL